MDQDPAMRLPRWALPVAVVTAAGVIACGGGGESGGGNTDTGNQGGVDIPAGTEFHTTPDGRACGKTDTTAHHVHIPQQQNGWNGVGQTDTTKGLPGMSSFCRTNTDPGNGGMMWYKVS